MELLRPSTWEDALAAKDAHPDAVPIWGGTDLMVELNFDRRRPDHVLDLTRIRELAEWGPADGRLRVGAGVTYSRLIDELGHRLPGLAMAARTVGSPQIRNRGTIGGNLGTASPAGDGLPPLYVADAEVEVASAAGSRRLPVAAFVTGPKRNALLPGELIAAFHVPPAAGPQQYAKIGTRNAMVIAVCSLGLALNARERRVAACIGSAGPTPIRATEAERFLAGVLAEERMWDAPRALEPSVLRRFGELVRGAARPIGDVRGTAAYRSRAVGTLAERTCRWAWDEWRGAA